MWPRSSNRWVDEDVALIEVWNKIDALSPATRQALRNTDKRTEGAQAISHPHRRGAGRSDCGD